MRQAQHARRVGVATRIEGGAAGAALWRGAETARKADALRRYCIEMSGGDGLSAIAAEMVTEIVTVDQNEIRHLTFFTPS
jgi:hypothetical protein